MWKPLISTSKPRYTMNSWELKNENTSIVFYGPPLFSIQISEKNIKKGKTQ